MLFILLKLFKYSIHSNIQMITAFESFKQKIFSDFAIIPIIEFIELSKSFNHFNIQGIEIIMIILKNFYSLLL